MHAWKSIPAIVVLLAATATHAATDPGLTLHETYPLARQLRIGAQARVRIPLGQPRSGPEPAVLSLRAGPSLARNAVSVSPRQRNAIAPLAELAIRPSHSITWSLAGRPLAASYTAPALREQAEREHSSARNNLSTVAIVAIGVGVAAIVGGLLFIDAVNDASD